MRPPSFPIMFVVLAFPREVRCRFRPIPDSRSCDRFALRRFLPGCAWAATYGLLLTEAMRVCREPSRQRCLEPAGKPHEAASEGLPLYASPLCLSGALTGPHSGLEQVAASLATGRPERGSEASDAAALSGHLTDVSGILMVSGRGARTGDNHAAPAHAPDQCAPLVERLGIFLRHVILQVSSTMERGASCRAAHRQAHDPETAGQRQRTPMAGFVQIDSLEVAISLSGGAPSPHQPMRLKQLKNCIAL